MTQDSNVCAAGESSVLYIIYVYVVEHLGSRPLMVYEYESESQELGIGIGL
jgi:hypothetical protein